MTTLFDRAGRGKVMRAVWIALVFVTAGLFSAPSVAAQARPTKAGSKPSANHAITSADLRAAAAAAELTMRGTQVLNACDEPINAVERKDLNGDGQPEVIFADAGVCSGNAGFFTITAKVSNGTWRQLLTSPGLYTLLPGRNQGWPDIQTGGPGCNGQDPKFRWNGSKYVENGSTPQRCTMGDTEAVTTNKPTNKTQGQPSRYPKPDTGVTLVAAKAYIDNIYHVVTTDAGHEDPAMRPYLAPRYTPALRTLVEQADKKEDELWLGANPFCDCQDHADGTTFTSNVVSAGPNKAVAVVVIRGNFGAAQQTFRVDLEVTQGQWAVANIHSRTISDFSAAVRRYVTTGASIYAAFNKPPPQGTTRAPAKPATKGKVAARPSPPPPPPVPSIPPASFVGAIQPSQQWFGILTGNTEGSRFVNMFVSQDSGKLSGKVDYYPLRQGASGSWPLTGKYRDGNCELKFGGSTYRGPCSSTAFRGVKKFLGKAEMMVVAAASGRDRLQAIEVAPQMT